MPLRLCDLLRNESCWYQSMVLSIQTPKDARGREEIVDASRSGAILAVTMKWVGTVGRTRVRWVLMLATACGCESAYVGPPREALTSTGRGSGGTAQAVSTTAQGGTSAIAETHGSSGGVSGMDEGSGGRMGAVGGTSNTRSTNNTGGMGNVAGSSGAGGVNSTGGMSEVGGTSSVGGTSDTGGSGGFHPARLWPERPPRGTRISVCWSASAVANRTVEGQAIEVSSGYTAGTYRQALRKVIDNTWGRFTDITFVDVNDSNTSIEWSQCASESPANTIVLDFTSNQAYASAGPSSFAPTIVRVHVPNDSLDDFATAAIRSFGQALGILGPDHGGELRPADIATGQSLYGQKHGGALVGWGGRCMDVDQAPEVVDFLKDMIVRDCEIRAPQYWRPYEIPDVGVNALIVRYRGAGYCATTYDGISVKTGDCMPGWHWGLPLTKLQWRGWGNLCVTATSIEVGASLRLLPCNDLLPQRWELFKDWGAHIQLSGTNLCVSAWQDSRAAAPDHLALAECNADAMTQSFDLSVHELVRYDRNACIQANGSDLGIASTCDATVLEQSFHVSGAIESNDVEGCLSVPRDSFNNGVPVRLESCESATAQVGLLPEWQTWDYHW
jgi:hypothetical protein